MEPPLLIVTGFGPFEDVVDNPTARLALELERRPPEGLQVHAGVLPVSFERAPDAWDEVLARGPRPPRALLSLGVQKEPDFRIERRARVGTDGQRTDNDGGVARGARYRVPRDLENDLDLEPLLEAMRAAGARAQESGDAGGYLCERIHHRVLAESQARGIPGIFLHTPPEEAFSFEFQFPILQALAARLVRS